MGRQHCAVCTEACACLRAPEVCLLMATARIWPAARHRCRIRSQHPSSVNISAQTLLCSVEETWLAHYKPRLFLLKPCFLSSWSMTGQQLILLIYHPHTYSCITLFKFNHSVRRVRPAAVSEAAHKWLLLLLPGASVHKKVTGRRIRHGSAVLIHAQGMVCQSVCLLAHTQQADEGLNIGNDPMAIVQAMGLHMKHFPDSRPVVPVALKADGDFRNASHLHFCYSPWEASNLSVY